VKWIALPALLQAPPQDAEGPGDSSRIEAFYAGQFSVYLGYERKALRYRLI